MPVSVDALPAKILNDFEAARQNFAVVDRNTGRIKALLDAVESTANTANTTANAAIPKSLVDAKGDLLVGTANDTVARKAVGSDKQVLESDSSQGDGLNWVRHVASTVEDLKVIRGIINTTTPTIVKGSGFSIGKNATGDVTVTFTAGFSDTPSVAHAAGESAGVLQTKLNAAPSSTTARILLFVANPFAANDGLFHFIAIGPR